MYIKLVVITVVSRSEERGEIAVSYSCACNDLLMLRQDLVLKLNEVNVK